MTAPHDLSPVREPRRGVLPKVLLAIVLVAMFVGGIASFFWDDIRGLGGGIGSPEVRGEILWESDRLAAQLGPGGWVTHPGEGGDYVARNVRTDEQWTFGEAVAQREITADGVVLQPDEHTLRVQREGSTQTATTEQIADAHGDDDLWPGADIELVGVSDEHVAALTCLAPSRAGLNDDVEGGTRVLAGIALEDASVAWTHDTEVPCGIDSPTMAYPSTLPAQQYLLVEESEEQSHAVDLATGEVVREWTGTRRSDLTIQGEHVLEPKGEDAVAWRSLATGKALATVECAGARAGDPQEITRQLGPEVTPFVECRDETHYVRGDDFVAVDAPPARGPVSSDEVSVGDTLVRHTGDGFALRDAVSGREVATVDVPEDAEIGRFGPLGRLISFTEVDTGGDRPTVHYRVVDSTSGELVLDSGEGMRGGAKVTPEGEIMVTLDDEDPTGSRVWVAGTKGTS